MNQTLFTVEQAASQLQVSKSIIYALVDAGRLACHRIGLGRGTIRFSEEDLASYLDSTRIDNAAKVTRPRRKRLRHIKL